MSSANPKQRSGGVNKSAVSYAAKLHRIHAGASSSRLEFDAPVRVTWRGEGEDVAIKTAMAHRLATCWNVCEGIPTTLLLEGFLRDLVTAIDAGDLAAAQELVSRMDRGIDRSHGRLHDCPGCLRSGGDPGAEEAASTEDQAGT